MSRTNGRARRHFTAEEKATILRRQLAVFRRAILLASGLVSLLCGLLVALAPPWGYYDAGSLALPAATLFLAWRGSIADDRRLFVAVLVLLSAQFGILVATMVRTEDVSSHRLLRVAIIVLYLAVFLSVFQVRSKIVEPINALLLSFSSAVGLFVGESGLEWLSKSGDPVPSGPEWTGVAQPDSLLGFVNGPYSERKNYYPDNPRGYFEVEHREGRERTWELQVIEGSKATLEFPPSDSATVRIAVVKGNSDVLWHLQLNRPRLRVESGRSYTVDFRARADRPRSIVVGFARAREPRTTLGLYETIGLTSEWREVSTRFVAPASDSNARIHFDVAGSDIPVEVSTVVLRRVPDGLVITPELPPERYFVSYKFNGLGCRGRDYPMARATGSTRILSLGDSFTMGVGVHEPDTFSSQLERELRSGEKGEPSDSAKIYEVINCGVSGYGTRQERLFYELVGVKYQPDIVLLTMVGNDDLGYLEEIAKGYHDRRAGKLEGLFRIWGGIQEYRHQRRTWDYSKSVAEILQLDREVRAHGGRLVVTIFRSDKRANWMQLLRTVDSGLQNTAIPILDLGIALLANHREADLMVHAIDRHPNEIAHKVAAQEIRRLLEGTHLPSH